MKRRPHWDDDLITAVCATGDDGEVDYWMTSDQVYRIIAAVEDWHEAKRDARVRTHSAECWRWHQECAEYRIEKLSAQVQAVREACEPFGPMGSIAVWRVLRALDGDNDA